MARSRSRASTALLVFLVSFGAACAESTPEPPRLVLLYAPCTVSKYFLSPWNDAITFTPNIAAFAAKSLVFSRHQTETGQSGISYASLFTGTQADQHQVYRHPTSLDESQYLIFEAYADAGYETFFWNGHLAASAALEYAQGVKAKNLRGGRLNADDPRFAAILDKLAADPNYKAFIVTNFMETHGPYSKEFAGRFLREYPGESLGVTMDDVRQYEGRYRRNHIGLTWNHKATLARMELESELPKLARVIELLYRANINELDRLFGAVVDAIEHRNLLDESLIVFTTDHGEVMYRESATFNWTHSMLLDHEVIGVPLIVHSPWLAKIESPYPHVTRSIDVLPTMVGLSGFSLPKEHPVAGTDLRTLMKPNAGAHPLWAFSHSTVLVKSVFKQMYEPEHVEKWEEARRLFPDESVEQIWVAVRVGDEWFKHRKLVTGQWVTQLYDLAADPDANRDVFDSTNEHHINMRDALLEYKAMLVRNYARQAGAPPDSALEAERRDELLRKLGYIE